MSGSNKIMGKRKKPWTDKQYTKYFVKRVVEAEDVLSWTGEELVKYVVHELGGNASLARSLVEALLSEEGYGFVCEGQEETLIEILSRMKRVLALYDIMRCWLLEDASVMAPRETEDCPPSIIDHSIL